MSTPLSRHILRVALILFCVPVLTVGEPLVLDVIKLGNVSTPLVGSNRTSLGTRPS